MLFPIMINIKNKEVVVVGAGEVALRKVEALLQYGPRITVVSPSFVEGFKGIEDKLRCMKSLYKEEFLEKAYMVVAATASREINRDIEEYCRKNRILCNIADDSSNSDFQIPSALKRGDLVIAVSTGGASPALSSRIKRQLEDIYTEEYEEYVQLLGEVRGLLLKAAGDEVVRRNTLRELIDLSIEELKERRAEYESISGFQRE